MNQMVQSFSSTPIDNWIPPSGLGLETHRETQWTTSAVFAMLVAVAFLGAASAMLLLWRPIRFDAETEAAITRYSRVRSEHGEHAIVSYRFEHNGHEFTGKGQIATTVGPRFMVRFLKSNPAMNEPVRDLSYTGKWGFLFAMFTGALVLIGRLRRERRLLIRGVPVRGVVTSVSGGTHPSFGYEFRTLDGVSGTGRWDGSLRVGTEVCVLYDPGNPRRNATYPLKFVRLARSRYTEC